MVEVSEWDFDPTPPKMLLVMAMSSESTSGNLRVARVLHYKIGLQLVWLVRPWQNLFFFFTADLKTLVLFMLILCVFLFPN